MIKKGKISALFWASNKCISVDTIDINIGGWTVKFKRGLYIKKIEGKRKLFRGMYYWSAWCRGTMGYIPTGRFIYNTKSKEWIYIIEQDIIKEKIKRMP